VRFVIVLAALGLAGCGAREPLRPADGQSLPRAPALSGRALTPEQLLAVPSEFRPVRVDEPLTRSQRREPDRFALPPPDETGALPDAEDDEVEGTGEGQAEPEPRTTPAVSPQ